MIWKTSRNEKHKYFDEETLPHSEKKKTQVLSEILSRGITATILLIYHFCFDFTFTEYTNILNIVFLIVRKGKKWFKSEPSPWLLKF